jgi:hypothetical protein
MDRRPELLIEQLQLSLDFDEAHSPSTGFIEPFKGQPTSYDLFRRKCKFEAHI